MNLLQILSPHNGLAWWEKRRLSLTEEQQRMYTAEKLDNFRWISKLLASYSPYTLTDADIVSPELDAELAELGQFAELIYSVPVVPIQFLLTNIDLLKASGFPLEVSSFIGTNADLPVYLVYRPTLKQLVVAISGTTSWKHALQDVRAFRRLCPPHKGSVHSGFWYLYQGIKNEAMSIIRRALKNYDVNELVITGHSMGGSISYLLCLDLLLDCDSLLSGMRLKIVVFGAPRSGNKTFVEYWRTLVASYKQVNGRDSFQEYSVKGYNDGVPALPPMLLGYRHFSSQSFYAVEGLLFRIPPTESEYALFHVAPEHDGIARTPQFPHGGHNYYNGRELERFIRRIFWLERAKPNEHAWEERYVSFTAKVP
ncbi:Alpha/Beta hydrolase protein [Cyathus striatus]|nr:Alpha/Beta hydrolase protein [Cyathus striatus]